MSFSNLIFCRTYVSIYLLRCYWQESTTSFAIRRRLSRRRIIVDTSALVVVGTLWTSSSTTSAATRIPMTAHVGGLLGQLPAARPGARSQATIPARPRLRGSKQGQHGVPESYLLQHNNQDLRKCWKRLIGLHARCHARH